MIREAIYLSAGDIALGLFLFSALALVLWKMGREQRGFPESKVAESVRRVEAETKEEEWDFPPPWRPEAETDFHDRKVA